MLTPMTDIAKSWRECLLETGYLLAYSDCMDIMTKISETMDNDEVRVAILQTVALMEANKAYRQVTGFEPVPSDLGAEG